MTDSLTSSSHSDSQSYPDKYSEIHSNSEKDSSSESNSVTNSVSSSGTNSISSSGTNSESSSESNKISLLFAEPNSLDFDQDDYDYVVLDIEEKLLDLIRQGPEIKEDDDGRAYIFGPLLDLDDYEHPGCHDVHHGFTGLLDLEKVEEREEKKEKEKEEEKVEQQHTRDYEKKYGPTKINKDYLHQIQKDYPEILWIGSVPSGLKDAHIHFHIDDPTDTVDSIIIDMEYFFHSEINDDSSDSAEVHEYNLEDSYSSSEEI